MPVNNSLKQKNNWLGQATCLLLLTSAIAACENRETVVNPTPEVTPTVVVTPTPAPTTVIVTPSPVPTNTIVATPVPESPTAASPGAQTTPNVNPAVAPNEPITDVTVITNPTDTQSILNRSVQLTNVNVQRVVGDRTFWIGQPNGQAVFVVLAPPLDAGSAENKVVIKPGQTVNLTGVLKPLPTVEQAQQEWSLSPTEAQTLKNQALYLQAERVQFQ